MNNIKNPLYLIVFITLSLSSCTSLLPDPHKIEVHQGNIIDADKLAQLNIGMSREQVTYLLGSPVTGNAFHGDRWDYLHYISEAGSYNEPQRVTVYFRDDTVQKIDNHYDTE